MGTVICGIDEAGRGPVIGPMVVAGVWATPQQEHLLTDMGVKDSKRHSVSRREELARRIREHCPYEMVVVQPEDIDALRATMSLNQLEVHLFVRVAQSRRADVYYLDAVSTDEDWFGRTFRHYLDTHARVISEHEADDRYPVVSAASIMAKVERDRALAAIAAHLEPHLDIPLGSGYPSDKRTRTFIKKWLQQYGDLPPHTRRSWKTVRTLRREMEQKRLV